MESFLSEEFLLHTRTARTLYHDFAEGMPIFDYHCHLPVEEIARDRNFENLTQIWLNGDHYKWRAMRTCGVPERLITGDAGDEEKFQAWAETVPKTLRNPLYHWTHLELKRYFGISGRTLNPGTATEIYETCSRVLQSGSLSTRKILRQMDVRVVFTTDDPVDDLREHLLIREDPSFPVKVLPGFRPDKALSIESPGAFNRWTDRLEAAADLHVGNFDAFIEALRRRHDHFHASGCRASDHGIEFLNVEEFTPSRIHGIFQEVRGGREPSPEEARQFRSAMLLELAGMDAEKGWIQQFHLGALRNINTRAMQERGPDTGYDSIGDFELARGLAGFLDNLARDQKLARTILYTINPRDNEMIAAMIGSFQDGAVRGKIQFGPAWWFNDQKEGIERQINALSSLGLLSCFVGMVTDSRSFLSFPRHEYFRRVLCNLLGQEVENGEIPNDVDLVGNLVKDVCYRNAANYFGVDI
jgi:glucuronate isomerase